VYWLGVVKRALQPAAVTKTATYTQLQIGDLIVSVIRKPIKHLHIRVLLPDGRVRVSAPLILSDRQIEQTVLQRWDWIQNVRARLAAHQAMTVKRYESGEQHAYLGRLYVLQLEPVASGFGVSLEAGVLRMRCAEDVSVKKRQQLLDAFYRHTLMQLLPDLFEQWQQKLGVQVSRWSIKKMKSRWGSCQTRDRRIVLNLHLAKTSLEVIEYVLVHELAHFIESNHSARFHAIVAQHIPHWRLLHAQLKCLSTHEVLA
jgi:hypothetical protein